MNLADRTAAIEPRTGESPWPDHEYVRGFAILVLPFSSGQMLAFRDFRESTFAPYRSVWHRSAGGQWSLFNDGPALETTCARYWGPAAERAELADVDAAWTGPNELRVEMDEPRLEWTTSFGASGALRMANAASASVPLRAWRSPRFVGVQEWTARRLLGLGDVSLSFTMPSGHDSVLVPEATFFVTDAEAVMEGQSLGEPTTPDAVPTIGDVALPPRTAVVAQAQMRILDHEEHRQTRERVRERASGSSAAKA